MDWMTDPGGGMPHVEDSNLGHWSCDRSPADVSVTSSGKDFSTNTERSAAVAFLPVQHERSKPLKTPKYLQDGALVYE